ncbi:MAG: TonB family protein [Chitinophagales bacterium]
MRVIAKLLYVYWYAFIIALTVPVTGFSNNFSPPALSSKTNKVRLSNFEKSKLIKIQRLLRANAALKDFSGVVLIAKDGRPIYKFAAGFANLDYNIGSNLDTQFNLCAITQSFTATAILQMVERGALDLHTDIGTYVPEIAQRFKYPITIHQLLNHSAGVKDYYNLPAYVHNFHKIDNFNRLLDIVSTEELEFVPGSMSNFSNSNYVILAAIIERVTKESYQDYMRKNVLEPAKMTGSGFYEWDNVVANKAVGYDFTKDGEAVRNFQYLGAHAFGADGLYASANELLAFEKALENHSLIRQSTKDMMYYTDNQSIMSESGSVYGYGWEVSILEDGTRVLSQGSDLLSLSTQFRRYVDDGYSVIVLSNFFVNQAEKIANEIESAIYQDDYYVPADAEAYLVYESIKTLGVDETINQFDDLLKRRQISLNHPISLSVLGNDLIKAENYEDALKVLQLNVSRFPDDVKAVNTLAETYYKLGHPDLAHQYFKKGVALDPKNDWARAMLSLSKEQAKENNRLAKNKPKKDANIITADDEVIEEIFTYKSDNQVTIAKTEVVHSAAMTPPAIEEPNNRKQALASTTTNSTALQVTSASANDVPVLTPISKNRPKPKKKVKGKKPSNYNVSFSQIYTVVDQMPEFGGGQAALFSYIYDNMSYPTRKMKRNPLEGTVYVNFTIDEQGVVRNPLIQSGLGDDATPLHNEALKVIEEMPEWKAGIKDGKPVPVSYTVPIRFEYPEK